MTIFDKLCAKLVFGKDGKIMWFGVVCLIGAIIFLSAVLSCFTGCCNVFTVRNPLSDTKVEQCYQSTYMAFDMSCIVTCPQMMSDNPSDYHFSPENILLLPIGVIILADGVVELVGDTLFLPFDWPISVSRQKEREAERKRQEEEWKRRSEEELRVKAASVAEKGGVK